MKAVTDRADARSAPSIRLAHLKRWQKKTMNPDTSNFLSSLLPILGVGLGWFLKELSDLIRGSADSRRARRKSLFYLIRLHQEMVRVERILNQVKDATGDWRIFEVFRARYAEQYGDKSQDFITGLSQAVQRMSEDDPWSAIELRHVLETYLSLKDIKLQQLQNMGLDPYIRGLSTIEATYSTGIKALEILIRAEARRCGIVTYTRTWLSLRRFRKIMTMKIPHGLDSDLKSLFEKLSKKENEPNKAAEPTPVAVTPPANAGAAPATSVAHLKR